MSTNAQVLQGRVTKETKKSRKKKEKKKKPAPALQYYFLHGTFQVSMGTVVLTPSLLAAGRGTFPIKMTISVPSGIEVTEALVDQQLHAGHLHSGKVPEAFKGSLVLVDRIALEINERQFNRFNTQLNTDGYRNEIDTFSNELKALKLPLHVATFLLKQFKLSSRHRDDEVGRELRALESLFLTGVVSDEKTKALLPRFRILTALEDEVPLDRRLWIAGLVLSVHSLRHDFKPVITFFVSTLFPMVKLELFLDILRSLHPFDQGRLFVERLLFLGLTVLHLQTAAKILLSIMKRVKDTEFQEKLARFLPVTEVIIKHYVPLLQRLGLPIPPSLAKVMDTLTQRYLPQMETLEALTLRMDSYQPTPNHRDESGVMSGHELTLVNQITVSLSEVSTKSKSEKARFLASFWKFAEKLWRGNFIGSDVSQIRMLVVHYFRMMEFAISYSLLDARSPLVEQVHQLWCYGKALSFCCVTCTDSRKIDRSKYVCSHCRLFRYCSSECQDLNWQTHKQICGEDLEDRLKTLLTHKVPFNAEEIIKK